jgi:hypothetical protein
MRFKTKYDRWLVILLLIAAVCTCALIPVLSLRERGFSKAWLWTNLILLTIWAIALFSTLPQYYEVKQEGLFLRQGWRKRLIPYASLMGLHKNSDSRSAGVFSTDRILITTKEGKRFLIAVAEEARFLDEVAQRSPQLERRSSGLGLPFAL